MASPRTRPNARRTVAVAGVGAVAGATASWVKSIGEPPLQRLGERLFPPTPDQKALLGADVTGRPERMPPAVLIRRLSRWTTGRESEEGRSTDLMPAIHYGFGIGFGVAYSLLGQRRPEVTMAVGVPAGAVLWLATHGSIVPAVGLQASPAAMPRSWWVWELGSHLVFGAALEVARRGGMSLLRRAI